MKIKDPWIAKEKFKFLSKPLSQLDYYKWTEFIDKNNDYFTWIEDTEDGKKTLASIDKVPESFREGVLKGHNKRKAYAEFNGTKGYHEIVIQFNEELNVIGTTFMKKITKEHIKRLLKLANHMEALLLNNGTTIIDDNYLKTLE